MGTQQYAPMSQHTVIGIDLGGTKCSVVRFRADTWTPEAEEVFATRAQDGLPAIMGDVTNAVEKLRRPDTHAVGLGIAGLVRHEDGLVLKAPNIRESANIPVRRFLSERVGLPVQVDNDAHCFALAEARIGAGRGHDIVIGVTMGTGVGGGIVVDGVLFRGSRGIAGEIGHALLRPGEPPYKTADQRGEVEQFLSGTAMGKRCEEAKRPEEYLEGEVCSFLRPEVFREVAWLCTNMTYILDPSVIIFGGSAGRALKIHLPLIRTELEKWMLPDTPRPELTVGELEHPGALGAALLTVEIAH
ncbi:MAG: glucokinase [Candidatus Peregrinibacteria bacterium Greene0416_19]|nr:MAG: glucokinase [Candidatus Peregrinibacteria bacterium Greene0416_19]